MAASLEEKKQVNTIGFVVVVCCGGNFSAFSASRALPFPFARATFAPLLVLLANLLAGQLLACEPPFSLPEFVQTKHATFSLFDAKFDIRHWPKSRVIY